MFGGGEPGCLARVTPDTQALVVGRCGCVGYTTDPGTAREDVPVVDVVALRLRQPDEPVRDTTPQLAPMRDVLDEGRRLRDLSEVDGLPWRPAS